MTTTLHAAHHHRTTHVPVRLLGIGTYTPGHIAQSEAADLVESLSCDTDEQRKFLRRIFANSGVATRASVLAGDSDLMHGQVQDFFRPRKSADDRGPTTQQRMALYERLAPEMATRSARAALAAADMDAAAITHLIPVTCTGFFSPGLDVRLIEQLGLRRTTQRVQVGFMGCHGAFNALIAAKAIVSADPRARVLVSCVELCTLHLAYGFDAQRLVANALFADGSASVIVGGEGSGTAAPELIAASTMLMPDSQEAMTWRIGDHGFAMTLSPSIPDLVRQHVPSWISRFLAEHLAEGQRVDHYAIHPGGPKVLTAVADAIGFDRAGLEPSLNVLRTHGNMSSATILFVLDELRRNTASGHLLAMGFGPGLTAEVILMRT